MQIFSNKFLLLAAFFCVVALGAAERSWAASTVFHSAKYGYHLKLPDSWEQIPSKVIEDFSKQVFNKKKRKQGFYDSGFQLTSSKQWLEYPYVIVEVIPYSYFGLRRQIYESQFSKITQAITGMDIKKIKQENFSEDIRKQIDKASFGKVILDKKHYCYKFSVDVNVTGKGQVHGAAVGHFGKRAIIQVMFYTKSSSWAHFANARKEILNSFRFDANSAYDPTLSKPDPSTKSAIRSAVFGAIVGLIIAFFITRYQRRKGSKMKR